RAVEVPQLGSMNGLIGMWIFSGDGSRLAAIVGYPNDSGPRTGVGMLAVFDGTTGRLLVAPFEPFPETRADGTRQLIFLMSEFDQRLVAAVNRRPGSTDPRLGYFTIHDGGTGNEIRRIECPGIVTELALSADGSRIAVEFIELEEKIESRKVGVN